MKMTSDKKELKTAPLSLRLTPSVKALAERRAREEDRSLGSYISRLILADAAAQKKK